MVEQTHLHRNLKIDTNHMENKAEYTATPVACGWAGAYLRSLDRLGRSSEAKDCKNPKKVKCDGPMDGWTDRQTDGPKKRGVESRSTRLKMSNRK